jgi:arylsulfatase A-like enzyme
VPEAETSEALVANVDLAPTFADLAGADVPGFVDGRSLAALWRDPANASYERVAVLLEHWPVVLPGAPSATEATAGTGAAGAGGAGDEPVVVAPLDPEARGEGPGPPEYRGVRTARYTYVEYVTGDIELYDNEADPDQLTNLAADAPPALLAELADLVAALETCAGQACRDAEETVVAP